MMTRLCAWLVLGAMLVLPSGGHAEDTSSSRVRFQFAWSVEERALAREALWRLPTSLLRIDRVQAKMEDMPFELTLPEAITLGLALSRYYDREVPEKNAIARHLFTQLGGRSETRSPFPSGATTSPMDRRHSQAARPNTFGRRTARQTTRGKTAQCETSGHRTRGYRPCRRQNGSTSAIARKRPPP